MEEEEESLTDDIWRSPQNGRLSPRWEEELEKEKFEEAIEVVKKYLEDEEKVNYLISELELREKGKRRMSRFSTIPTPSSIFIFIGLLWLKHYPTVGLLSIFFKHPWTCQHVLKRNGLEYEYETFIVYFLMYEYETLIYLFLNLHIKHWKNFRDLPWMRSHCEKAARFLLALRALFLALGRVQKFPFSPFTSPISLFHFLLSLSLPLFLILFLFSLSLSLSIPIPSPALSLFFCRDLFIYYLLLSPPLSLSLPPSLFLSMATRNRSEKYRELREESRSQGRRFTVARSSYLSLSLSYTHTFANKHTYTHTHIHTHTY